MSLFRKIDKTKVYAPDGGADLYADSGMCEWELDSTVVEPVLNEEARDSRDKLFAKIMSNLEAGKEGEKSQKLTELSLEAIRASTKTFLEENVVDDN